LKSLDWPAPAKLNLFLHVTRQRADGYHELQTLFQFIDYCDWLAFDIRDDGQIHRHVEYDNVSFEQDLTVRAAQALQVYTGCEQGADLYIEKHLPIGGGLGGGSSDAATVLVALNELWSTGLSQNALLEIGLSLGADIPVFIYGHSAWAEGVGEQLTAVEPETPYYLVIHPGCEVSTKAVFTAPDLTRHTPAITIRDFLESGGRNDCEPIVREQHPAVAAALDWLGGYAKARLTGTGSCLFAAFVDRDEAEAVLNSMPHQWQGFIARGLNRSPLLDRLDRERVADSETIR